MQANMCCTMCTESASMPCAAILLVDLHRVPVSGVPFCPGAEAGGRKLSKLQKRRAKADKEAAIRQAVR